MVRKRRLLTTRRAKSPYRPAESAGKRKRNRMILKSMLIGVVGVDAVLVLLLLYLVFLHMPYFNLQQVDVTGNHHLSREEVIEASELERGINLLTVNLGGIAEQLKRHPWIRSASVYRRFPGRIIVEIRERTPRAILAAGKLYYVDEQAEFYTRLFPGDPVHYPLFTGVKPERIGVTRSSHPGVDEKGARSSGSAGTEGVRPEPGSDFRGSHKYRRGIDPVHHVRSGRRARQEQL